MGTEIERKYRVVGDAFASLYGPVPDDEGRSELVILHG